MLVNTVIIFNILIAILNIYWLYKLLQFRAYLSRVNEYLSQVSDSLIINLKEIPLIILLTALEIKNFKQNYLQINLKINKTKKIIIFLKLVYQVSQNKKVLKIYS